MKLKKLQHKLIIALLIIATIGCVNNNKYSYQVHLMDGTGTMHLYTGHDYKDAVDYIKEYEKSHGDLTLIKVVRNK